MPDTCSVRRQASLDEVDLQLAIRSMAAEARPSLSSTVPLPVLSAEHLDSVDTVTVTGTTRGGLLVPGGVLAAAAALLVVAVVSVSHQSARIEPTEVIPVGSVPAKESAAPMAPTPAVPPTAAAPPINVDTPTAVPSSPVGPAPIPGMPQQRFRQLLNRLAGRG